MSWQTKVFADLIDQARAGDRQAEAAVRAMVKRCSTSAPLEALLRIATVLLEIGQEMSQAEIESN